MIAEPTALLFAARRHPAGMRVLDLGSGPGDVAFQVAADGRPRRHVVGVEQDPARSPSPSSVGTRLASATSSSAKATRALRRRRAVRRRRLPVAAHAPAGRRRRPRPPCAQPASGRCLRRRRLRHGGVRALSRGRAVLARRAMAEGRFRTCPGRIRSVGMRFPSSSGRRALATSVARPAGLLAARKPDRHRRTWSVSCARSKTPSWPPASPPRRSWGSTRSSSGSSRPSSRPTRCARADGGRRMGTSTRVAPHARFRSRTCCNVGWTRSPAVRLERLGAVLADPRAPFPRRHIGTRLIARSSVVAAGSDSRQLRSMAVAASRPVVHTL